MAAAWPCPLQQGSKHGDALLPEWRQLVLALLPERVDHMQLLASSMEIVSVHRADPFVSRGRLSACLGHVERYQMSCAVPAHGDRLAQLLAHWKRGQLSALEDQDL